ncbi:putative Rod shape-determining protein mreC [Waddlia chondrophila 2032/99]|uniref:Cell shape-determining protein MreC n=2 Tax=Waddlia chondrophila TaxID=71667 RepID=D6YTJ2_WADCW|nr:rod shape-determining protein MreC [Waddlia chondrophila]ADI37453.1 putative Rod shape-determining protein mreC [Waddlia chondrophila WSU 86-1044]CCB90877.1 putative Rod shape-determining protein mreC [Waddlia chondrophila 2032/99]
MRSFSPKPFLQLLAVLLTLLSVSKSTSEKVQGYSIAILAPTWNQLAIIKQGIQHLSEETFEEDGKTLYVHEEIQKLHIENQLLKNEIATLKELLKQEQKRDLVTSKELEAAPAQVIFRPGTSWNTVLWINVGKEHNKQLGKQVISQNSPVVVGTNVVGLVDYVGNKQSRVRLITDPSLTPSVRSVRVVDGRTWYLAKGELKGSSLSQYRTKEKLLIGTGFNYDFPDQEGPARDLRSGAVLGDQSKHYPALDIIMPNDLLVTTGMDGVFPSGLCVATVTKVNMLKEGDYYYDIEAEPCCTNLDHLMIVSVLPPQGFDPCDQPSPYQLPN